MSLVAIVGRPNVGKSTLFNRLVGMRQAIVDETAGVTRDRHYGRCEWCGNEFSVVDTGGYTSDSEDIFEDEIRKQVLLAIEESDLVLFMVEALTGITDYDQEIADILRRSGKKVILAVNKVDTGDKMYDVYQFYSLGFDNLFSISSATGGGTGDFCGYDDNGRRNGTCRIFQMVMHENCKACKLQSDSYLYNLYDIISILGNVY